MQTMLWILLVAIVWLVPVVACALEQGLLGRLVALLAQGWRGRSVVGRLLLVVFVVVMVVRGGAKQSSGGGNDEQSNGQLRRPHCNDLAGDCFVPRNDGEGEFGIDGEGEFGIDGEGEFGIDGEGEFGMRNSECGIDNEPRTNGLWIADFAVVATNRSVAFVVKWANDAFDAAESRGIDLFMATNLVGRWTWLNRWMMPLSTNECVFGVNEEDVDVGARDAFTNSFSCAAAFFRMGLDVDGDGDGLTDAYERLVSGTSPMCTDGDDDGLSDGWEVANVAFTGSHTNVYEFTAPVGDLYFKFFRDINGNGVYDVGTEFSKVVTVNAKSTYATVNIALNKDFDNDKDDVYDCWELAHGMSPNNGADKWHDPDNDGLLNLHEYWLDSHPMVHDQTNSVIQLFTQSVDSRLMMNATSNEVAAVLPKFENYTTNNFSLNTNFWLRDVDTSSVSMWTDQVPANSNEWSETVTSQRSGVAISKRHILQAHHWAVERNNHVVFYGTDGNVYTNKVIGSRLVGGDIRIGLLEDELPDAVSIIQVMPTNFFNYLGNAYRIPVVFLDQKEEARIFEIAELDFTDQVFWYLGTAWRRGETANESRNHYYKTPIGGDSGSPFFYIAGNQPTLMGAARRNDYSSFIGFYVNQIQAAMDYLLPGESDRHRLQIFDMSIYSQIIPERITQ